MNEITLEWQEGDRLRREVIQDGQPSKNLGTVRLGRDPARCDIVLLHPTVSGLHLEILFDTQHDRFLVRNLRGESNPPMVDGKKLLQGEMPIHQGSIIQLGQVILNVTEVSAGIPATILIPPEAPAKSISVPPQGVAPTAPPLYGLKCPNCSHISPFDRQHQPCSNCGRFLVNAESVLIAPKE